MRSIINHIFPLAISFLKLFILGGKGEFTIVSGATGKKISYRIRKDKDNHLRIRTAINGRWKYIGTIMCGGLFQRTEDSPLVIRKLGSYPTPKPRCSEEELAFTVFHSLWNMHILRGRNVDEMSPAGVSFMYNGKCAYCGKKLKSSTEARARGIGLGCMKLIVASRANEVNLF